MATLLRDIRYAVRVLARSPAFTLTVVVTLALAIGANSAVFSAINTVLLRPLTFPEADRLVAVTESREGAPASNTAPVRIEQWNERNATFEAITGYYTEDVSETSGELPERFRLARVAPRFFDVWGVEPALGRGFTAAENDEGAPAVAVISHRYWQTRLRSDPNVLDRRIRLGEEAYAIVGVMSASFEFPDSDVDIWVPRVYFPYVMSRNNLWYRGYGRLKRGVSAEQAHADLARVQAALGEEYPDTDRDVGVAVVPLKETTVGSVRGSLWLLFGAVSVLLLIASTNIAALLLSRAARREQEISIRLSLGASRRSLAVAMLTETAVLALFGAALGLVVAAGAAAAFRAFAPRFPRVEEIAIDGRILLYTLVSILVVTLLCGLVPALRGARGSLNGLMAEARRTQVSTRHSVQWLFVGIQVALSVVLLAGAGLLIRSFEALSRVEPGFEPGHVLSFRVSGSYADFGPLAARVDAVLAELGALPGIETAAVSSPVPGVVNDGSGFQFGIAEWEVPDGRVDTESRVLSRYRVVSPSYFATMRIPVGDGELCALPPAGGANQIMVNRTFATRYFPGVSPVGRRLRQIGGEGSYRIAGVIGDAREYALDRRPEAVVYDCRTAYATPALSFLVRTRGDPLEAVPAVRTTLKALAPLRAVYDVVPLAERMGGEYAQDRLRTILLSLFALTALALACLGVYGTLSYIVSLRRREVGLRVALGALQRRIVAQFLLKAMRVVGTACFVGLALSFVLTRGLSGMLYGVAPWDPFTLASVVAIVLAVAGLAAWLPALRAARIDPMRALREE